MSIGLKIEAEFNKFMKNTDMLIAEYAGGKLQYPVWLVLRAIDNLSDEDKTDLCKTVADMIGDDKLRLSILDRYCKNCGKNLYNNSVCHCENDE